MPDKAVAEEKKASLVWGEDHVFVPYSEELAMEWWRLKWLKVPLKPPAKPPADAADPTTK